MFVIRLGLMSFADFVTIFGESAGSCSVTALAISSEARGLFRRVIAESGEVAPKSREAGSCQQNYRLLSMCYNIFSASLNHIWKKKV